MSYRIGYKNREDIIAWRLGGSALEGDDRALGLTLKPELREKSSPTGRNVRSKGLEIEGTSQWEERKGNR